MHSDQPSVEIIYSGDHRRPICAIQAAQRGRSAQRWRQVSGGDAASGEIGRHGASARVVSSIPDPPCRRDPSGGIVPSIGARQGRSWLMIYHSGEQAPAAQFGEHVARIAAGMASHRASAPPPPTRVARHAKRRSDIGRSHAVQSALGSPARNCSIDAAVIVVLPPIFRASSFPALMSR
jgi:hypothetical protein